MEAMSAVSARIIHSDIHYRRAQRKDVVPTKLQDAGDAFGSAIDLFRKEMTQNATDRRDSSCTLVDEVMNYCYLTSKRNSLVQSNAPMEEIKKSASSKSSLKSHRRRHSSDSESDVASAHEVASFRNHPYKSHETTVAPEPSPPLRRRLRETSREIQAIYQSVFACQLAAQAPTVGWAPAAAA